MMNDLTESMPNDGVSVDIHFHARRPNFGDLLAMCKKSHPGFPAAGGNAFEALAELQFSQVEDYFGIRSRDDHGADVIVRLYPLVQGVSVHHHPGPFHALRLEFDVLRNPRCHVDHFMRCVFRISSLGESVSFRDTPAVLDKGGCLIALHRDIAAITAYWRDKGIVLGSSAALGTNESAHED